VVFWVLGLRDFLRGFSPQEVPEWDIYREFQALGWSLGFFPSLQKGQDFQALVEVLHPPCAGVDAGLYRAHSLGGIGGLRDGALRSENPQRPEGRKAKG
jgi:hypothetical protein